LKYGDFPFVPLDLARNLGFFTLAKVGIEILCGRLRAKKQNGNFESFAINTYGKTISERFLLNYSEKLWGQPCDKLSSVIAGKRLQGLNLRSILLDSLLPGEVKSGHLEGTFYYPKFGIDTISNKLAETCGHRNILTDSRVTGIAYNNEKIEAIEINSKEWIETDEVVSTLPLGFFIKAMKPSAPDYLLRQADRLRFRSLILVSLFIDRKSVTQAATVYFPEMSFPFTRLYEPKNRSTYMSPAQKTSLIVEIPCQMGDRLWTLTDGKLVEIVYSKLTDIGWIKKTEIMNSSVRRLECAYPVLEASVEEAVQEIRAYLQDFSNLKLSGRNGKFVYSWIHDMMRFGKEIVEQYSREYKKEAPGTTALKISEAKVTSRKADDIAEKLYL